MGWFKKKDNPSKARDPELPLSIAQAQRLRELVRVEWARLGREVSVRSDHVVDAEGSVFGLWNLAVMVADAPARDWPQVVADHVGRLGRAAPGVETLSDEQLRAQVVLRLTEGAGLPDRSAFATAPVLVGDLLQVLAIDLPETVMTPQESDLAARGSLDEWRAVGRANLWHMMRSEPREHQVLEPADGGSFDVLLGESVYTASMALFLPEVMAFVNKWDIGRGVLVAVPCRHQIAFRVIDGPDAVPALNHLFMFAMSGYDEGAGPLSPHVFWVKGGRWTQITERDGDSARILVGTQLAEALGMPSE